MTEESPGEDPKLRDKPRSYTDIVGEWIKEHSALVVVVLGGFAAFNLAVTALILTHVYLFEVFNPEPESFADVEWWMFIVDTIIWVGVLIALYLYVTGRINVKYSD